MGITSVYFKATNEFLRTSYIYFRRRIRWAWHVALWEEESYIVIVVLNLREVGHSDDLV
jgi:hypothetical protein